MDAFAKLMDDHWEMSKRIDKGSANTLIDQIFDSVGDLIDGRMICGAGYGYKCLGLYFGLIFIVNSYCK